MPLINDFDQRYVLGHALMDQTHREFVDLVNRLAEVRGDDFAALYAELVAHTRAHFDAEEALMVQSGFPAINEHRADHARVLGDLDRFGERLGGVRAQMARAYVTDQLPRWFDQHAATMDSALAAHLTGSVAVRFG